MKLWPIKDTIYRENYIRNKKKRNKAEQDVLRIL